MFIRLLQAFSDVIFHTAVQQMTNFNWNSASPCPSSVAELLVWF